MKMFFFCTEFFYSKIIKSISLKVEKKIKKKLNFFIKMLDFILSLLYNVYIK